MQFIKNKIYMVLSQFIKNKKSNLLHFSFLNFFYTVANVFFFTLVLISVLILFYTISFYMQITVVRYLAVWLGVGLSFYWVLAALWCLFDKDDYGRGVSASDDFYNVAFTSFWLIEGFLLALFLSYARLFDFYDPFLESDEIEASFLNEDVDSGSFRTLLLCFATTLIVSLAIDFFVSYESFNFFWFILSIYFFFFCILLSFLKTSVRFVEEFDFEEDGDFIFDETDNLFEHEDFPEEGFDGGDYAEGYEILQLFFGYWHYAFIIIHLTYLIYAVFSSNGRQQNIYWAVAAIAQNIVILLILDLLDWAEVFSTYDIVSFETIYSWFYFSEDSISSFYAIFDDLKQLASICFDFVNNTLFEKDFCYVLSDEELKSVVLKELTSNEA